MIVLDANVLIALFDAADALHEDAVRLLSAHVDDRLLLSPITAAEVLEGPARLDRAADVARRLDRLGVRGADLSFTDAPVLAAMRASTGLKLPDCCVLLLALQRSAAVATFDDRLARAAATRGVAVLR